ncbi:nitric-oxide reductase large subunit [Polyangium sp. 6x1]|uniref:nitric-oxide reductase large subunit n=1 Tax=Polyangium sp. 6x1 TaxID=3042689 RepID=UPI002482DD49|nr:nitric-oxide reductase large subunit [Polyangium sp. 6x1]MDI1443558.1 nitric-oxide reductase large subunit [Polyangium sp. 6x1]
MGTGKSTKGTFRGLWISLTVVIVASFAVLGFFGWQIHQKAPPLPQRVVTDDGVVLFTHDDIQDGKNVWQSMGGQQVGSIWGHGGYVAPDWSADWLHREGTYLAEAIARAEYGQGFEALDVPKRAAAEALVQAEIRKNTYDAVTGDLRVSSRRAEAIRATASHYNGLFGDDPTLGSLREAYAIPIRSVPDPERRRMMTAFFFWASWSCVTERADEHVSYTNNWPPDELVGNRVTAPIVVWSIVSFVLLLAGIGGLSWYFAAKGHEEEAPPSLLPRKDPLLQLEPTPSMKATIKFFWVAAALCVAQVGLGAVSAHYGVEGSGFYGIPLAEILPYSVTRTWHVQLAIFWIATTWLATGLFMAPAVGGEEPRLQRAGVNFLFTCLLIIVVGSLFGTWYSTRQRMGLETSFWFGHQGLEYTDIGRFWQIFLFVGLILWLVLMVRALRPALARRDDQRNLVGLFLLSSLGIALFYAAGLMWGRHTHLSMVEYWRWWVVHLWVEGFFEVFATVIIAFLLVRLGLLRPRSASRATLFSTIIFLSGGVIGTFHHLYFTGTPMPVLALGAVFSALEVVPLSLIGFEAYGNLRLVGLRPWVSSYKWPIYFFVAVAFWNLVGAGLFGFLINPPIALYYMQGLNTTPVHGHTAMFGVYGMLGFGLMLFCLRGVSARFAWKTGALSFAFWAINIGLAAMAFVSLLPVGIMQAIASVEKGMWYARSAEFLQTPLMDAFRWSRVLGDTIFAAGILALAYFLIGLRTGWSLSPQETTTPTTTLPPPPPNPEEALPAPASLPPLTLRGEK